MNVYLVAAVACLVAVGAAGVQGFRLGRDAEIAANAVRAENARKDAEERENHNRFLARSEAKNLQVALGRQKELSRDLGTALEAHIRAMPAPPAGCPAAGISDELFNDINRALAGANAPGGALPRTGRAANAADGQGAGNGTQEAGGSR